MIFIFYFNILSNNWQTYNQSKSNCIGTNWHKFTILRKVRLSMESSMIIIFFFSSSSYPLVKFYFWKGEWVQGSACAQLWRFPKISLFPMTLNLKLFNNFWGNLHTQLLVIVIFLRFTCGECQKVNGCKNIFWLTLAMLF